MARLHEYQGKAILAANGFSIPRGRAASTPDEAVAVAKELMDQKGSEVVIKIQAWTTGRAALGGVAFAKKPDVARGHAARMLEMKVGQFPVEAVLVEEKIAIEREFFLSFAIDDATRAPIIIFAAGGGTGWIDEDYASDDSALNFTFTIAQGMHGTFTVVDAGFAGDTFSITNFGNMIGATSGVAAGSSSGPLEFDFDAAFANPAYSHGVFTLGAGTYSISGSLLQSVDGDLDATNGAVRLSVSAVPEPTSSALMMGGFAALALLARRRKSASAI